MKANTEVHKVDGMTTLAWNLWCPSRRQPGSWILNNSEWLCLFFFFFLKEEAYLKELNNSFLLCSPGTGKGRVPRAGTVHIIKLKSGQWPLIKWLTGELNVPPGDIRCFEVLRSLEADKIANLVFSPLCQPTDISFHKTQVEYPPCLPTCSLTAGLFFALFLF